MMFLVSKEQLNEFARQFWAEVGTAKVFAFYGPMGAGKTTIITALCRSKGVHDVITSPTFSIINEYDFSGNGQERKIYHMDLYRLNSREEVIQAGVEDCIYSGAICMVEWPEKAPDLWPADTVSVYIEAVTENNRRIKVETPAPHRQ
jgi:tRNA threonylcarbamoyladenosine biosynthesis protein TsaE